MDDGDIDEKFEWFCDYILPTLGIPDEDQVSIDAAYEDWLADDFSRMEDL